MNKQNSLMRGRCLCDKLHGRPPWHYFCSHSSSHRSDSHIL